VVHWSALVNDGAQTVGNVMTDALIFPNTVRVSAALREFMATHQQLALVIDEHGSVDGIVTLEDLLEEMVGEIYDETDRDTAGVTPAEDGSYVLPGTFPIHDLEDLGINRDEPRGDYTTVAGLILHHLGRVPDQPGDAVTASGWTIEVLDVSHHAITAPCSAPHRQPETTAPVRRTQGHAGARVMHPSASEQSASTRETAGQASLIQLLGGGRPRATSRRLAFHEAGAMDPESTGRPGSHAGS